MLDRAKCITLLLSAMLTATAWAQSAPWFLMSRHGECTDAGRALRHKFRDLPAVSGPNEFAEEMKRRGHAARLTERFGGNADAVLVEVPSQEVSMIFVRRAVCREFSAPR